MPNNEANGESIRSEIDVLLSRARMGDGDALSELISRHRLSIRRTAYAILRNFDEAEDVVQDVALILVKKLNSFAGDSSFSTWLTRIAINTSLMRLRQLRRRRLVPLEDVVNGDLAYFEPASDPFRSPEQECSSEELKALLAQAVSRLPISLREAAQDHIYGELPMAGVAAKRGVSLAAAKSRAHRARKMLMVSLGGRHAITTETRAPRGRGSVGRLA